jgi:virginiamycin B lyase
MAGPDGVLWFANTGDNAIGQITTAGVITIFNHHDISGTQGMTAGPDGAIWFTNESGNSIGQITTTAG